ncbi:hypothetical protein [Flocculibacter collagenilyticus]|uniref:hypothetical protein n=1 Tax=Flocculibacter collagenilyticus TaxID=2744479 RepID=UPI0018F43EEA|nr:hypothetical protein [Flocculibacter collagenilyticus]
MAKKKDTDAKKEQDGIKVAPKTKDNPVHSGLRTLYWLLIIAIFSVVLYIGFEAFKVIYEGTKNT